jgi:Cu+-exporting ATPase
MKKENKKKHRNELVKDIVCGMVKPKDQMKAKSVFKGKTYYFCTEMDKQMFEAYPDRWVTNENPKGG